MVSHPVAVPRMAKRIASPSLIAVAALLLAAAGCQQQPPPPLVRLPPPNFNGPQIADRSHMVAAPGPQASAQPRRSPAPATPRMQGGIPTGWLPPVPPRQWQCIVVHHSATAAGGARAFDAAHRAKGWDELGYDFVIGNGTDTGDGQVEVGPRWIKQKWGAHDKTPDNYYNEHGIGICLVGNFDVQRPTAAQLRSLLRLSSYLMRTYHISANRIFGHGETKSTDCPGRMLNMTELRRLAAQSAMADAGPDGSPEPHVAAASGELLFDVK
jgi:hypothetical protein